MIIRDRANGAAPGRPFPAQGGAFQQQQQQQQQLQQQQQQNAARAGPPGGFAVITTMKPFRMKCCGRLLQQAPGPAQAPGVQVNPQYTSFYKAMIKPHNSGKFG